MLAAPAKKFGRRILSPDSALECVMNGFNSSKGGSTIINLHEQRVVSP